jgi:hypothetical protein
MGIPPIISNFPILKSLVNFKSNISSSDETKGLSSKQPQDVVEVSDLARQQLDGIKPLTISSEGELRELLKETRDMLSSSQVSFGLDVNSLNT